MMGFFFDILNSEMFYSYEKTSKSLSQLEQAIVDYLNYYNNKRIKVKLKPIRLTPKKLVTFQFILNHKPSYVQETLYLELNNLSRFYQNLTEDIVYTKTVCTRFYRSLFLNCKTSCWHHLGNNIETWS